VIPRLAAIVVISCLADALAVPARAIAQPAPADATVEARARALYDEGDRLYNLAEYEQAIERFKEAYKLLPEPLFLYNIAQAYRQKGDCASARTFYRNYLRAAPEAENRAKVEQRIAEMESCAPPAPPEPPTKKEPAPVPVAPAPAPVAPAPGVHARADAAPRRGEVPRIAGLATAGVGVVLLGAAGWFARDASSQAEKLETLCRMPCDASDPDVLAADRDGVRADRLAIASSIAGGVALVGGAALYWWGWRQGREAPALSLVPTRSGAVAGVSWSY